MKIRMKDFKDKAVLVITILFMIGTVYGCDYPTEEPTINEDKVIQPTLDVTSEPIPKVTDIPNTPNKTSDSSPSLTLGQRNALSSALSYLFLLIWQLNI